MFTRDPRRAPAPRAADGFAAVDALAALSIISVSTIAGLAVVQQAEKVAGRAAEVRRAHTLMDFLLAAAPRSFESASGAEDEFSWRVETAPVGADRPVAICRRAIVVQSLASGRVYDTATLETCPEPTP